jgi:O-antigen/teichoic acid export membrane protein
MKQNVTFGDIVKKSGGYAAAVLASRALSFILIPFYTRYLTTADYGVLELLDLTLNFVIVFAGSRLGQALFYYYFVETDGETRKTHISTSIFGSFALGAALCGLTRLTATPLSSFVFGTPEYGHYFRLVAVAMGLTIPLETYLCTVRLFDEPRRYSIVTGLRTLLAGLLNIIMLGFLHMGVSSMLWSSIISQAVIILLLSWHIFKRVPVRFSMELLRRQAKYSVPLSVSSVGEFIVNYGDRYFLRRSVSLSEIGIYSLAYKIGMLIPLVQYPFALFWSSQQVKIVRGEGGMKIFSRVFTYLALALTLCTILIAFLIEPVLRIMVSPAFRVAAKYAPWIALAYLLRAVGAHFREMFIIEKRPALEARVTWVGTLVCLAGYAVLIPRFGLWGAVDATLGSFAVVFFYSYFSAQRLRRVVYEYKRVLTVFTTALSLSAVFAVFAPAHLWLRAGFGMLLGAVFFVILHFCRFWQIDEKEYIGRLIRGIRERGQRDVVPSVL